MANALMMGFLSGAAGAADSYSSIKKDQREFKQEQLKADAQMKRQQNFARFQYSLKGSSMYNEAGKEYTNEQYGALSPEAQGSALNQFDMKERAAASAKKDNYSQWMDESGKKYTYGEIEERGGTDGLMTESKYKENVQEQKEIRAEGRQDKKQKAATKAAKAKQEAKDINTIEKAFSSTIKSNIENNTLGSTPQPEDIIKSQVDAVKALRGSYDSEQLEKVLRSRPAIQESLKVDALANTLYQKMTQDNFPYSDVSKFLADNGYPGKGGEAVIKYMVKQGMLRKGILDKMLGSYSAVQE